MQLSKRGEQWQEFSAKVLDHIENYTVPQYGDAPDDQAEGWTFDQCMESIQRYKNRAGSNARPGEEGRDLLKIAHYACLASGKLDVKEVFTPYKSWDYCKHVKCVNLGNKELCEFHCSVYEFHQYLKNNNQIREEE